MPDFSTPPPLGPRPVAAPPKPRARRGVVLLVGCLLVLGALLLAGAVWSVQLFSKQIAAVLQRGQKTDVVRLDKVELSRNAATTASRRPDRVAWLEKAWQADGLADPAPSLIPPDRWRPFAKAVIEYDTGGPEAVSLRMLRGMAVDLLPVADRHPVAAYVVAQTLGDHEEVRRLLQVAVEGLSDRAGQETLASHAAAALALAPQGNATRAQVKAERQAAMAALRRALEAEEGYASRPDSLVVFLLMGQSRKDLLDQAHEEFSAAVTACAPARPWLKHWIAGRHHIEKAWEARGSGYASTVTPQGWRTFHAEIARAKAALGAARDARPDAAEPCEALITCALASSPTPLADMQQAFQEAVSVQVDHPGSYGRMLWGLRPRWHGSFASMIRFGEQCMDTGRYDTRVPWVYLEAHRDCASEWDLPDAYFQGLRDYSRFRTLFDGFENEPRRQPWRSHDRTHAAITGFKCGQYADAQKWLEKLDFKPSPWVLETWQMDEALLVGKTGAFSGSQGGTLRRAEKAELAFQAAEARDLYRQALDAAPAMPETGRRYVEDHVAAMEMEAALGGGDSVAIAPKPGFAGWSRRGGGWKLAGDGESLEHGSAGRRSVTTSLARVGPAFTLEGEVEFEKAAGDATGWISFGYPEKKDGFRWLAVEFSLSGGRQAVHLTKALEERVHSSPLDAAPLHRFVLRVHESGIDLQVGDQGVWKKVRVPRGFVEEQYSQIGFGAATDNPEARVRFHHLRLRRSS